MGNATLPIVAGEDLVRRAGDSMPLWHCVCGEYLEMPGLILSVPQAARLWDEDGHVVQQVLDELVSERFLRRAGECYARADWAGIGWTDADTSICTAPTSFQRLKGEKSRASRWVFRTQRFPLSTERD